VLTIDSQVHAYERNHPGRPWAMALPGPPEVTGDDMIAAMDEAGVDAALLISPASFYLYDPSYALNVYADHPARFRVIKPFDPTDPAIEEQIADWAAIEGTVGVRLMLLGDASQDPEDPGINLALATARRHSLPVNLLCWGRLDQAAALAARHPDAQLVIDHLGLTQAFAPPPPPNPFAELPSLLALAAQDNVAVKISGAGTMSHRPFPYDDLWEPLGRIFDAFGLERCLWGTDWTRAVDFLSYKQGVDAFLLAERLSDSDRAMLMGGALQRVYGWTPAPAPRSRQPAE
jgi:predicted TIM-barrel fold metal-dependent hydrolase